MKYKSFFIAFCLVLPTFLDAQSDNTKWSYNVQIGGNISFMSHANKDVFSDDLFFGYSAGFGAKYYLNDNFALSSALLLSKSGSKWLFDADSTYEGKSITELRYYYTKLSLPLSVDVKLTKGLWLGVGAKLSCIMFMNELLDCSTAAVLVRYPLDGYNEFSNSAFNRFDVAALVSLSYTADKYSVSLSYDHGFLPVIKQVYISADKFNSRVFDVNAKARIINLSVKYLF